MLPPPTTTAGLDAEIDDLGELSRHERGRARRRSRNPESWRERFAGELRAGPGGRWAVRLRRRSCASVVSSTRSAGSVGGQLTRLRQLLAQPVPGEPPSRRPSRRSWRRPRPAGSGSSSTSSLTNGWSSRTLSLKNASSFPRRSWGSRSRASPSSERLLLEDLPLVLERRRREHRRG